MMRNLAVGALAALLTACASGGSVPTFTSLTITGSEIQDSGLETAYDVLASHRELLVTGDEVAFRGGYDLDTNDSRSKPVGGVRYYRPMIIVDGNRDVGDVTTALRRIPAQTILLIRLIYASEVPARMRRPEAAGGVIEITTREGATRL